MVVPWSDDPPGSSGQILSNVRSLLTNLAADSSKRKPPTVAAAQEWHRKLYDGVTLPVPYYAGEIRDSDPRFPELDGYEVRVGPLRGVPSALVPQELANFEASAQRATARLDGVLPAGDKPGRASELQAVVNLCALLHGEWVRIHAFANGNGRTARVWANWAAMRYRLPPFVVVKSRPDGDAYALAGYAGMRGQHQVAAAIFHQMLNRYLRSLP